MCVCVLVCVFARMCVCVLVCDTHAFVITTAQSLTVFHGQQLSLPLHTQKLQSFEKTPKAVCVCVCVCVWTVEGYLLGAHGCL